MATMRERNKVLANIDKVKVIAVLGLLGGMLLLAAGLASLRALALMGYPYPAEILGLMYTSAIVTIVWASLALSSPVILLRGYKMGYIILLVAGIGGMVGTFIPLSEDYPIFLNTSPFMYIDLVLMVIGGIYGVALPEKTHEILVDHKKTEFEEDLRQLPPDRV